MTNTYQHVQIPFSVIERTHPEMPGVTLTTLRTQSPDGLEDICFHRFSNSPNDLHISIGNAEGVEPLQCWLCPEQVAVILQHLNQWATEAQPGVASVKH